MYDIEQAKVGILLPHLSFLKKAHFINLFFDAMEKSMVLTYPLSLYVRDDSGKIRWLGFVFAFLFTRKNGKKSVQLTYPVSFDEKRQEEIYERLLKEVEELASDWEADRIEVEGYRNISGDIFEPLSSIAFGNVPNFEFMRFLKIKGFLKEEVKPCYQITWSPRQQESENFRAYTVSDFRQRKKQYLELLQLSDSCAQLVSPSHLAALSPPITERFYFNEEWVIFTQSEMRRGCLRWFPQSLFDEGMTREAKVVRILHGKAPPEFVDCSMTAGFNKISLHGISTLQVADISSGSDEESFLKTWGGFKVYETVRLIQYC
jgi:hypothetical protein